MRRLYSEVLNTYIEVPETPKVVSLAPSITDTLYRIGAWENVVGVSLYCNIPEEAGKKPRVGAYLNINYDKLDELKPDLILTTTGAQRNLTMELWDKGYTVYPIPLPTSIYGIIDNIVLTGYLVGRAAESLKVARKYLKLLNTVEYTVDENVYYEILFEEPYTIGQYSYITTSLHHIGLKNIFMDIEKSYFKPDFNEVLERNPGIIIYELKPNMKISYNELVELFEDRGWSDIDAVRNNQIYILEPDTLAHYGPTHIQNLIKLYNKIISRY